MTVSSMFTQGYMDEPSSATVTVVVTRDLGASLAADQSFLAALSPWTALRAALAAAQSFLASLRGEGVLRATVQAGAEVQAVVVAGDDLQAVLSCDP